MVDVAFQTSARLAKVNVITNVTLLGRNVKLGADLLGDFHLAIHFIEFACFVVLDDVVAFAIGKEVWSLAMFRFVVEVKIIFDPVRAQIRTECNYHDEKKLQYMQSTDTELTLDTSPVPDIH